MSSESIRVIAHLYPAKGKADEVLALLRGVADYVRSNEPGTTEYKIHQGSKPADDGQSEIIMIETYKDKNALKVHGSSPAFKQFSKTLGDKQLLRAATQLKVISDVGGFGSRL